MVIGLAMCTTAAFAQIQKFAPQNHKVNLNANQINNVDYKASIFTKDDGDTIRLFTFESVDSIIYGDAGTITTAHGNTSINGNETLETHTSQSEATVFRYIADSATLEAEQQSIYATYANYYYPTLRAYMCGRYSQGGDNGFMFMAMLEDMNDGIRQHASFTLPPVPNPGTYAIFDVCMIQRYRKFNSDHCYIDYKLDNGTWKSWEVNLRGIDVVTNEYAAFRPAFTMPLELVQQQNIQLRVRWFSNSNVGDAYGYFWAIDDLCIVGGSADRWKQYTECYADGAYGIMPQGMKIPLAWYSNISNNGTNNRNGIHAKVSIVTPENGELVTTTLIDKAQGSLNAGNPSEQKMLYVDERDLFSYADGDTNWSTYWFGYSNYYQTTGVPSNYKYLPVETTGARYVTTTATSNGAEPLEWDTIRYMVTDRTGSEEDGTIYGYRWAHDNGLVGNDSRYELAFTESPAGSGNYVWSSASDELHYSKAGYTLALRYTTGSEIPTDENGNPWALLGVEIIPSTNAEDWEGMDDVEIQPVAMNLIFNEAGDGASFYNVATGFSTRNNFIVSADDHANFNEDGTAQQVVDAAGEIGIDYNAVVIPFPAQPYLEPNLSYYLGYELETDGFFAPASNTYGYYDAEGNFVRYYQDENYANRYFQFTPNDMDLYLFDGVNSQSSPYAANIDGVVPMIRAIVGPRRDIPTHEIQILCDPESQYDSLDFSILNAEQREICDQREQHFQGSSTTYYVIGTGKHGVIDEIIVDGVHYHDNDIVNGNTNLPDAIGYISAHEDTVMDLTVRTDNPVLWRNYFVVEFEDIQASHDLQATGHWQEWNLGIDNVATECVLSVQPNPASSQVMVKINGVDGMLNCNIIDMSGRVVYNSDFNAEQGQSIDLSSFARGAYFVRVTNGTFSKIEKLIVR